MEVAKRQGREKPAEEGQMKVQGWGENFRENSTPA